VACGARVGSDELLSGHGSLQYWAAVHEKSSTASRVPSRVSLARCSGDATDNDAARATTAAHAVMGAFMAHAAPCRRRRGSRFIEVSLVAECVALAPLFMASCSCP
jgi:hypothetical protein